MSAFLYASILSVLCALLHSLINFCAFRPRPEQETPITSIIRQGRIIVFSWAALLPLLLYFIIGKPLAIQGTIIYYAVGIIFFVFLFFIYISIYYIADRSVSSEIMIAIEDSEQKRLNKEQVERIYGIAQKYESELQGMIEGGFLSRNEQGYRNTRKGRIFAWYAYFFKRLYKIGLGGY